MSSSVGCHLPRTPSNTPDVGVKAVSVTSRNRNKPKYFFGENDCIIEHDKQELILLPSDQTTHNTCLTCDNSSYKHKINSNSFAHRASGAGPAPINLSKQLINMRKPSKFTRSDLIQIKSFHKKPGRKQSFPSAKVQL